MKIVWLSANKLGYELLKEARQLAGVNIDAIITLKENTKTVMYDGVSADKWRDLDLKVLEIDRINQEKALISSLAPDLIIICGWRQVIAKEILDVPSQGVIGFHPTLLPHGRGPAPIINTLLRGETRSGLSMYYLEAGLDDGDIIAQEEFMINTDDHAQDVYAKTIKAGKKLVKRYLPLVIQGQAPRASQDDSKALVFDKPSLNNNKIDLENESLTQVFSKIKALSKPYKGAYIEKGKQRLVIWRAELQDIK